MQKILSFVFVTSFLISCTQPSSPTPDTAEPIQQPPTTESITSTFTCPLTVPQVPVFVPPAPYDSLNSFKDHFRFGSNSLWTIIPSNGTWGSLPLNPRPELNVSHKEYNGDVVILTDRGRARRPLIVLKNGEPLISNEDLGKLARKEVDINSFIQRGLIEFIDAEEEEDLLIAMNPENITPEHTHMEIDPSLILGIGAAHVPFPEHNASPRVTMGAGMVKQALGFGAANMKLRPDTRGHLLHYVQKPLTHTQTSELIGSDDRPCRTELCRRYPFLRRLSTLPGSA